MTPTNAEIQVKNLDHLGLIAGIIDEIEIVDTIMDKLYVKGLTNIFLLIALGQKTIWQLAGVQKSGTLPI